MADIEIRLITEKDYEQTFKFQCDYLDGETFEKFVERVNANPDLYFCAFDDDVLVGVCYGHPSKPDSKSITLQGIAVDLDKNGKYARKGIGTALIKSFEKSVLQKGYDRIGVGSTEDIKAEMFYLKSGFKPIEIQAKGDNHFIFEKQRVKNYEEGLAKKEILREKYKPREVIFILSKNLSLP